MDFLLFSTKKFLYYVMASKHLPKRVDEITADCSYFRQTLCDYFPDDLDEEDERFINLLTRRLRFVLTDAMRRGEFIWRLGGQDYYCKEEE